MKVCRRCRSSLPLEAFHADKRARDGRQHNCKTCGAELKRAWVEQNREHYNTHARNRLANKDRLNAYKRSIYNAQKGSDLWLRKRYGLSTGDYDRLYAAQGNGCAICGVERNNNLLKKGRLCVDHDHENGYVRGLLCDSCNRGLAFFGDDPEMLRNAAAYLDRCRKTTSSPEGDQPLP
jgi:hypothetical protein